MRIAVVFQGSAASVAFAETAFWSRLRELGWVDGKNVLAEKRYADGDLDRLPRLIADVLSVRLNVLVAAGNRGAAAARKATKTIPIVGAMSDAVGAGLVTSLAQPGGNLTGVSISNADDIPTKLVELVHETIPDLSVFAAIVNPDNPVSEKTLGHISQSAATLGLTHLVLNASRAEDYPTAVKEARRRAQAAIIIADAVSSHNRELIAQLAEKQRLPTFAWASEFVSAGVLMAYGADEKATWRGVAEYVDKVLKGANPAELPIQQPTEYRLSINLRTAKVLRLTIPESILLRADEVIR